MLEYLTISELLIIWFGIAVAYIIFGISGFGTALIASPMLTLFLPVDKIIPLLALLDCSAAITNVAREFRHADAVEIKRLIPFMIIGSLLGAGILLFSRPDSLLLALGLFVIAYSLYSISGIKPIKTFSPKAAVPFGFIGGIFSALFGSGGFVYAIYLAGRIEDKNRFRITQTTLIGFSTFTRVMIFLFAGVYSDSWFILTALLLFPAMLIGTYTGRRITVNMSRQNFLRFINAIIFFSGFVLLIRYFAL
jgi:uncharacterized membrane protein YfcA